MPMVARYSQTDRPLKITTPLGPDILLISRLHGHEEISHLFDFQLSLIADLNNEVRFDAIVGQSVTVEMSQVDGSKRYFTGIVKCFSQGARDENFLHFRAQVVPRLWLLTKKIRSRIFQHLSVPDILKQVLVGFDVNYDITGTYFQRDYCVQYRESDFDFASRLMEEEGIYYFFKHSDGNHQMMVSDNISKHPTVAGQSNAIYEEAIGDVRTDLRVSSWNKIQEIRAGECTLWDHCFEVPTNHLEAKEKTIVSVPVGKVTHKLNLANDALEIYDYPGRYAQRFDGIDSTGGNRPSDIAHIFEDRTRTVRLRMEQEEVNGIVIEGKSDCGQFTAGHKFTLERHFDADACYLLTRVEHDATDEGYRSDHPSADQFKYENHFHCIPEALRFRPQRVTPVPLIAGMQTATVVGPPGEDIWVDKYGRVKVQFHWDREGKNNADSSCWLRVAQCWAGKGWGAFFWPRIGHEVVVIFEEGDPDQPMIMGSVYNAENMPWFSLPKNKELAGFKSASVQGTARRNYNGIVFNDQKGVEHLSIHSEHNLSLNSENDKMIHAGRHKGERVAVASTLTVGKLIPSTGGSGGGFGFDQGNPIPSPPPTGIIGLNSVFTLGDNLQAACPLNHQLVLGNNLQMCINPTGLIVGSKAQVPPLLEAFCGSGMGGNMQFTIGTNAQFTLGQSYEISIGPPKIEIHAPYSGHFTVNQMCLVIGISSAILLIAYDLIAAVAKASNASEYDGSECKPAATTGDETGDYLRAGLVLVYQILVECLLKSLWQLEAADDKTDWFADKVMKELYGADASILKLVGLDVPQDEDDKGWSHSGMVALGITGVAGVVAAEIALLATESTSQS
jgi:type VI secretion system secreted protein VgrG